MPHLVIEERDRIALVRLDRPAKRNAVNDALVAEIATFFRSPPEATRAVVLHGAGDHFCAGLDLSEHSARDAFATMLHSRSWHDAFEHIQFGRVPVIAAMHGAVIGGGMELATACHIRVADETAFYQMPEGQRGIFVGGGATVRVARVIGAHRMVEMMLTGRRCDAEEGLRLGLSHYRVGKGEALGKALELAATVAGMAPLSVYAILQSIARIDDMDASTGLFTESLVASLVQTGPEAQTRLKAFLERKKK